MWSEEGFANAGVDVLRAETEPNPRHSGKGGDWNNRLGGNEQWDGHWLCANGGAELVGGRLGWDESVPVICRCVLSDTHSGTRRAAMIWRSRRAAEPLAHSRVEHLPRGRGREHGRVGDVTDWGSSGAWSGAMQLQYCVFYHHTGVPTDELTIHKAGEWCNLLCWLKEREKKGDLTRALQWIIYYSPVSDKGKGSLHVRSSCLERKEIQQDFEIHSLLNMHWF